MERTVFMVLALVMQWFRPRYNAQLQLLTAQIRILRSRIDADRIVPNPKEKAELLALGAQLGHDVSEVMHVVKPATYRRWVRQKRTGHPFKYSGRPRIPMASRNLVLRLAKDNIPWGYRRIVGELKKLGISICSTTIRKILKEEGIHPAPDKGFKKPAVPWITFIRAHMDTMCGCDFLTKRIYTLRGVFTAYMLVWIHFESRKVYCSPATLHPDEEWVMQQARNASMWLDEMGVEPRFLIHDRDTKLTKKFSEFWKESGTRCIRIPLKAPRANSMAETWIESFKRECLNKFICFGLDHLDYIRARWVNYYNTRRPHRGIGKDNVVLDATFQPQHEGHVRCRQELGGIIKDYYRDAA